MNRSNKEGNHPSTGMVPSKSTLHYDMTHYKRNISILEFYNNDNTPLISVPWTTSTTAAPLETIP